MNSVFIFVFFSIIPFIQSTQEQSVPLLVGHSYSVYFDEKESEGIRRELITGKPEEQFFYFCEKAKGDHKKNCGVWIDKKGQKVKNANNNVKITDEGATISGMQVADSARYSRFPENSDPVQAILERVGVFVIEGPKPPKTY